MVEQRESLAKMFSAKSSRVNTNRGEAYYDSLMEMMTKRLQELEKSEVASRTSVMSVLEAEGVSRRELRVLHLCFHLVLHRLLHKQQNL